MTSSLAIATGRVAILNAAIKSTGDPTCEVSHNVSAVPVLVCDRIVTSSIWRYGNPRRDPRDLARHLAVRGRRVHSAAPRHFWTP
jgi:hypothetical protein